MKAKSPLREKKKPKRSTVRTWCPGGAEPIDWKWDHEGKYKKSTRFVRCKVCGQRFEAQNKECHDPGCVHSFVPNHKAY